MLNEWLPKGKNHLIKSRIEVDQEWLIQNDTEKESLYTFAR